MGDSALTRLARLQQSPHEFLRAVFTQDQVDKVNPIKRFPYDLEYIHIYVDVWMKNDRIVVPKSRRMKMTWTNICLYLWDTLFHQGRHNAIVSKKENDADDLIKRAEFIYDNLDQEIIPREILPKKRTKFGLLEFPEISSKLQGFPQGADQLRQFTLSGIMADEMAFWEQAQEAYSGSMPTLEGGGRFTAISSPAPGFFKRLVFDQLDKGESETVMTNVEGPKKFFVGQGIEVWKNPKNKFTVFQLHYTADPVKRDEKFKTNVKSSIPRQQYLQEYELSWESWAGFPVYPDFTRAAHTARNIKPHAGLPLLRGWDFGLTPACVVGQLQGNRLVILREFTQINMGADRFTDLVIAGCASHYPNWGIGGYMDFIDPSGEFRKDTDEGTCAKIMDKKGMHPVPGAIAWEERRSSVEHFLTKMDKSGAYLMVDESTCPMLIKGFQGGYRYADNAADIEPSKIRPVKDEHSHIHDALQYLCSRVRMKQTRRKKPIPNLHYGFLGGSGLN